MNDIRSGKVYGFLFMFFIVVLIVGGYILTVKITQNDNDIKNVNSDIAELEEEVTDELKIEKEEDYIYFTNVDSKSLEHEIVYQDIKFNINSSEAINIANTLNSEMASLRGTLKKISEQELTDEEKEKILYEEDDIYSTTFRKYTRYFYKNYASLLSEEYDYDCFNGAVYKSSESYVFDTNKGKLLTKNEVLALFDITIENIKAKVKEKLDKEQTMVDGVELIDITTTLNNFDNIENYALYINKSGFLTISYLVKTTQVDYNDVIIFN